MTAVMDALYSEAARYAVERERRSASALVQCVRERLIEGGGVIELHHLDRMSPSETAVLVRLERDAIAKEHTR